MHLKSHKSNKLNLLLKLNKNLTRINNMFLLIMMNLH